MKISLIFSVGAYTALTIGMCLLFAIPILQAQGLEKVLYVAPVLLILLAWGGTITSFGSDPRF